MLSEEQIQQAVYWACKQEVMAPKPGNVNCFSDGHEMVVNDFLLSAKAIAPIMAKPGLSVGERILFSIQATRAVVNTNTNLGIVLLMAPLCHAAAQIADFDQLPEALNNVLTHLSRDDANYCYEAIRLAEAGGLGKAAEQDISGTPTVTLLEAMKMAEERDQIALQYVSNFKTLWQVGLPTLTNALESGESVEWATAFAYLMLLSDAPDSLILRKHSWPQAIAVTEKAKQLVFEMKKNSRLDASLHQLTAWDNQLKQDAINPGTTADLVAATLLLHAFQHELPAHRISVP